MLATIARPIRLALVLVAAAACGDAEADGDAMQATVRDSAGVTIVENPMPPDSGGALALAAEPEVTIGVLEGAPEYQLFRVTLPVRLGDGRIVVPNGGTHEVRYFDASGRFLRATGGEGEGPGEFQGLFWVAALPGDSLLAYDTRNRRLSLLDAEGAFVRTVAIEGDVRFPFPLGMTDAEHVVFQTNGGFERIAEAPPGILQDTLSIFVVPWREGIAFTDTAMTVPGNELFLVREENFASIQPVLLTGSTEVGATSGSIHWAGTESWELRQYAPDGTLRRILRRAHEPVPVTDAMWDAAVERAVASNDDEASRIRERRMFGDMPRPSHLPPMSSVVVDRVGRVWVARSDADVENEEGSDWDVFDADGRWLALIELPPAFRPTDIGDDWLLGVAKDEFDVEQVRLYRILSTP